MSRIRQSGSSPYLFLIITLFLLMASAPAGAQAPAPAADPHRRLERLDYGLRLELERLAGDTDDAADDRKAALTERYRNHLRGLDQVIAHPPEAAVLHSKLCAVKSLVSNLERAARRGDALTLLPDLRPTAPRPPPGFVPTKRAPESDACDDAAPVEMGTATTGR